MIDLKNFLNIRIRNFFTADIEQEGEGAIPVDIFAICKKRGLQIKYVDFCSMWGEKHHNTTGALCQLEGKEPCLYIDEDVLTVDERYIAAEALAWLDIAPKRRVVGFFSNFPKRFPNDFSYASEWNHVRRKAEQILMPGKRLEEEYKKMAIPMSAIVAKTFLAPEPAARRRLDRFGFDYLEKHIRP